MFELEVSEEFAAWFETLAEPQAEEVAAALDLVAAAGSALGPSRASRLLLWFDSTVDSGTRVPELMGELAFRAAQVSAAFQDLLRWHDQVLRCLESPAFLAKLLKLEGVEAARAFEAVERVRHSVHAARVSMTLQGGQHASVNWVVAAALQQRGASIGKSKQAPPLDALKAAFSETLRRVGLESSELLERSSGLYEATLRGTSPALRLIYGLDTPGPSSGTPQRRQRAIALVGEPLTRRYYGDSVRRAEQRFRDYLKQLEPTLRAVP